MSDFEFKYFKVRQCDSTMKVGTDAMILGALVQTNEHINALDVGTGTGVLALMMAQKSTSLKIQAIDVDEPSYFESCYNFEQSPWKHRINSLLGDFLSYEFAQKFDLIVSNPPYYSTYNENKDARKAKARHVSSLQVKPFLKKISNILTDEGCFWVIIPFSDLHEWQSIAEENGLRMARRIELRGKAGKTPIRCVLMMDFKSTNTDVKTFSIRNDDNSYSDEYIALTKEFHGTHIG